VKPLVQRTQVHPFYHCFFTSSCRHDFLCWAWEIQISSCTREECAIYHLVPVRNVSLGLHLDVNIEGWNSELEFTVNNVVVCMSMEFRN
jgi:hypothetical protein